MTTIEQTDQTSGEAEKLRNEFVQWQCRVRQIAMRKNDGRPDDAIMPTVTLCGTDMPLGHIITVFCKAPAFSKTPELRHLAQRTCDQAERREKAIQYLSSTYYQRPREFSDTLTATFLPQSSAAAALSGADYCWLRFDAYGQRYDLHCNATSLPHGDPLYQATWWHNLLFNPNLHPDTVILSFEPNWRLSFASPAAV